MCRKNVIQIICSAFVVFAIYISLIMIIPKYYKGANAAQTNQLNAEEYIYSATQYDVVLVGSSQMNRINVNNIDADWYNLSFSGGCSLTGLDLILKKDIYPDKVLIEIDETILRGCDDDFVENVTTSNLLERVKYRPDYLFLSVYRPIIDIFISGLEGRSVNEMLIENEINEYQELLDQELLSQALEEISGYVYEMKKIGIDIYFVEMPDDYRMYDTPRANNIREMALKMFPEDEYNWITCNWRDYQTQDGIHLCKEDAERYGDYLKLVIE